MNFLSLSNKNFYIFMLIVICILIFVELKECNCTFKKDRNISIGLIFIYSLTTIGVFLLNIFL